MRNSILIRAVYRGKCGTKQSLSITLLKFNNIKKKYSGNYNKATYHMNIKINITCCKDTDALDMMNIDLYVTPFTK